MLSKWNSLTEKWLFFCFFMICFLLLNYWCGVEGFLAFFVITLIVSGSFKMLLTSLNIKLWLLFIWMKVIHLQCIIKSLFVCLFVCFNLNSKWYLLEPKIGIILFLLYWTLIHSCRCSGCRLIKTFHQDRWTFKYIQWQIWTPVNTNGLKLNLYKTCKSFVLSYINSSDLYWWWI